MKHIVILSLMLQWSLIKAQEKILSEASFREIIKAYHPVAKQATLDVRIAAAEVTVARGRFDPVLSFTDEKKEFDGQTYYDQKQSEIRIPTWYGIDLFAGNERINGSRVNPEETKGEINYIGFSVPLLQNVVIDKRRAALQQAKIFRKLAETSRKSIINNLTRDALKAYWDWWEKFHMNELIKSSLDNAKKRFQFVKSAYQLGDRPAIDTLEALTQVQIISARENDVFTQLERSRLELSTFLWTDTERPYELAPNIAPQKDVRLDSLVPFDDMLASLSSHPELSAYDFLFETLRVEKKLNFQSLLPEVKFKYNQITQNNFAFRNSAWFQNNYRFGFNVSVPLRLSEARGEYKVTNLKLEQAKLKQVNTRVQLSNRVRAEFTTWQQLLTQISLQNQIVSNSFALQRGEENRFRNGESSLFLVNARELRTIEAEQKLIETKAKSQKVMTELLWSSGLLAR